MNEFDQTQIRKLDGGLLLIFHELLLRRRASDVAQHLGLSPSAISHALTRLRDIFGQPLFIRRSHGLEPTQKALELAPRIEALLTLMGETLSSETGFDPARSRRRFRLACSEEIASLIGIDLVETFSHAAPRASFTVRWAILDRALRAVRRGEVDLALGVFRQIPAGLIATTLYEDDYCVIARRGHPVIQGSVDLVSYARTGHIFVGNPDGALAEESAIDREAMDATYGSLPPPGLIRTRGYVTLWETAMLIVSASDVLADCPRRLAERYADRLGLQVLDPPFTPFRFTVQAVRASGGDQGADWLLEQIAEALAT
jgi:DNA-binding transcriptional LysR family regulator